MSRDFVLPHTNASPERISWLRLTSGRINAIGCSLEKLDKRVIDMNSVWGLHGASCFRITPKSLTSRWNDQLVASAEKMTWRNMANLVTMPRYEALVMGLFLSCWYVQSLSYRASKCLPWALFVKAAPGHQEVFKSPPNTMPTLSMHVHDRRVLRWYTYLYLGVGFFLVFKHCFFDSAWSRYGSTVLRQTRRHQRSSFFDPWYSKVGSSKN